jgi:hypothetical protein
MMKNNIEKQKQYKFGYTFLCQVVAVYWLLYCALFPIAIAAIPIVPYLITNEENSGWLFLLSIPIGIASALKMWDIEFMSRNFKVH